MHEKNVLSHGFRFARTLEYQRNRSQAIVRKLNVFSQGFGVDAAHARHALLSLLDGGSEVRRSHGPSKHQTARCYGGAYSLLRRHAANAVWAGEFNTCLEEL